jgi:hypothetical protein
MGMGYDSCTLLIGVEMEKLFWIALAACAIHVIVRIGANNPRVRKFLKGE